MDLLRSFMLLLTILLGLARGQTEDSSQSNSDSKKIYCGRHLSQTLSAVCKGNYNTLNKKTDIYESNNYYVAQYTSEMQRDAEYPFKSKASATTLMSGFRRRRRRGVFNECCEKPCSHEELASYCGSKRR